MLIYHAAIGMLTLCAVVLGPPYLLGALAALGKPANRAKKAKGLAIGFWLLIEVAVGIDKGAPFFFGNIYNMVVMTPNPAAHLFLGAAGDGLWLVYLVGRSRKTAEATARLLKKQRRTRADKRPARKLR